MRLSHDLSLARRRFTARPGLSLVLVLTLALGIGASVAIFSVVKTLVLEAVPFEHPDRLAYLGEWTEQIPTMSVSWPNFVDWRERQRSFEAIAPHRYNVVNLTGDGRAEQVLTVWTSAALLPEVLRLEPHLGRFFTSDEDRTGRGAVTVLSHAFWQRRLGGDEQAIGRTVVLDGEPYEVIGVAPPEVVYPLWNESVAAWLPIGHFSDAPFLQRRDNHPGMYVTARLAPGVSHEAAEADMGRIAAELAAEYPESNEGHDVAYAPLSERTSRTVRPALQVLGGAVALVLLLACVNVANLLLARGAARTREMAVRSALGAGSGQLVRQLLVESLVLAAVGGLGGIAVTFGALRFLDASIDPRALPVSGPLAVDATVLAFAVGLTLVTGLVFGMAPALQALRHDVAHDLKEGTKGSDGPSKQRLRSALVVAQVALALVLLVGAVLFLRSFTNLLEADLGIDPEGVVAVEVTLGDDFGEDAEQVAFYESLQQRIAALPGVESASLTLPLLGGWQTSVVPQGRDEAESRAADITRVGAEYASTMGLRVLRGRFIDAGDTADARRVAAVDTTFADTFWPDADPIGRQVMVGGHEEPVEIVGLVEHVKNYGVDEESRIEIYLPMSQGPIPMATFLAKTTLDEPTALVPQIERELAALSSTVPLAEPRAVVDEIGRSILADRLLAQLLTTFGLVSLLLAALGLYGVLAYHVAQRRREIGIRVALGAGARELARLVVGQGFALTGVGIAVGLAGVWMAVPLLRSQLYGVPPRDPASLLAVALLLLAVAALASAVPLRRARRVDPATVLREE